MSIPDVRVRAPGVTLTLREALPTWIRIALLSFGGPAGQIAVMHRILVDEKRWIGEQRAHCGRLAALAASRRP